MFIRYLNRQDVSSSEFQMLMLIFMRSRRYLYVAFRQGPYNAGESNPVCLRYIVVLIHMLHHLQMFILFCAFQYRTPCRM